ncbi:MAG TPA: hypothetical protein VMG81_05385 [Thermoplasmata archaeon]|nr:hypothetical protein [Thermoplasmata archaeon]
MPQELAVTTLDAWSEVPDPITVILDVARRAGDVGFTVDDLRSEGLVLPNPGAPLGRLCSVGQLHVVGEEASRIRSSKGRKIRRFILTVQEGIA